MNNQEALDILVQIKVDFDKIVIPRYRHIDMVQWEPKYNQLVELKSWLIENRDYRALVNALSQALSRCRRIEDGKGEKESWILTSERGINKAIQPLVRRPGRKIESPFQWKDEKSGHTCSIANGHWEARNYMVMDMLAYFYLLREGGDQLPEHPTELFANMDSIRNRELEFEREVSLDAHLAINRKPSAKSIESIIKSKNWVNFTDRDFRKFTGLSLSSAEILTLLQETARVEFKLVYPVRLKENGKGHKENYYAMNMFSRLFELGYVDLESRETDGSVRLRKYYASFNTILGELFVHNLRAKNYDWIHRGLYALPSSAQLFARRLLVHNDASYLHFNLETVAQRLNLMDTNQTNQIRNIVENALQPLKDIGVIQGFRVEDALNTVKFLVYRAFGQGGHTYGGKQ